MVKRTRIWRDVRAAFNARLLRLPAKTRLLAGYLIRSRLLDGAAAAGARDACLIQLSHLVQPRTILTISWRMLIPRARQHNVVRHPLLPLLAFGPPPHHCAAARTHVHAPLTATTAYTLPTSA